MCLRVVEPERTHNRAHSVAGEGGVDEHIERTRVWVSELTDSDIAGYVASGEPRDKAGAYAIQGRAAKFIPRIEGCYYNVMGLPVAALYNLLQRK